MIGFVFGFSLLSEGEAIASTNETPSASHHSREHCATPTAAATAKGEALVRERRKKLPDALIAARRSYSREWGGEGGSGWSSAVTSTHEEGEMPNASRHSRNALALAESGERVGLEGESGEGGGGAADLTSARQPREVASAMRASETRERCARASPLEAKRGLREGERQRRHRSWHTLSTPSACASVMCAPGSGESSLALMACSKQEPGRRRGEVRRSVWRAERATRISSAVSLRLKVEG